MSKRDKIIVPNEKISMLRYLKMIWDYRNLTQSLAIGEIRDKYARTYTGVFLSFIQTAIGLAVYYVIFGLGLQVKTGNIPYPMFVLPGLMIWQYFSYLTGSAGGTLSQAQNLITKLYFPRLNLLLSKVIAGLPEIIAGSVIFIVFYFVEGYHVTSNLLWLPLVFLALVVTGIAVGLWISLFSLFVRDISNIILQITNFLIFITPVFYPSAIIPAQFKIVLYLNPIAGLIEFTRAILLCTDMPGPSHLIGILPVVLLFVTGLYMYKKYEKRISDMI